MAQAATKADVLTQAIRTWVAFELNDASVAEDVTVRAMDLFRLGASVAETCQLARNFVRNWLEWGYSTPSQPSGVALKTDAPSQLTGEGTHVVRVSRGAGHLAPARGDVMN